MKRLKISKQQGFTLVEIAIVLVIIGLLLGGILKGQELINSAKVRSLADQNSSVQAAYYGFIDRYRAVPGDMDKDEACKVIGANTLVGCSGVTGTAGGNGNGRLDKGNWQEASAVWAHLSAANFIVGEYPGTATNASSYDATQAPLNAFQQPILLGSTSSYLDAGGSTVPERLGLILGRSTPVNILSQLDIKIDNGKPMSGVLRATKQTGGDYGAISDRSTGCVDTTNKIWDVAKETQDCNSIYLY